MKTHFQKLDSGESPHLHAKHHFPRYRYYEFSTDKHWIDDLVNYHTKKNRATLVLEDTHGVYYLFVKK